MNFSSKPPPKGGGGALTVSFLYLESKIFKNFSYEACGLKTLHLSPIHFLSTTRQHTHLVFKHPPPLLTINSFIRSMAQFRGQTIQQIYKKNNVNTECTCEDEPRTR